MSDLYDKAILVYVASYRSSEMDYHIKEFLSLACSAKIHIVETVFNHYKLIHPKYFIGIGQLLKIEKMIKYQDLSLVVFSNTLSATQERNLSNFLKCTIIDRNQLILNLFTQRARTYEGKLQVKLAQLRYLKSRLVHEWKHLERQTGGIGIRGGPGEMQLETDRRLLNKNILQVLLNLKKITNQRKQNRLRRIKKGILTVSLVGYTNAGKSTLFNAMTLSSSYTSEKLFSTIDPTFRRIIDQDPSDIILIDTVGFIQNLPNDLIDSFKSTLEETVQSVLLLHVIDVSDINYTNNINAVNCVLNDMNIYNVPMLLIMNKIDQLNKKMLPHIDRNSEGLPIRVWISARDQLGIDLVKKALKELLPDNTIHYELRIPLNHDSLLQELYQLQAIKEYKFDSENTVKLKIHLSYIDWYRLLKCHRSLSNYIV